MFWKILLCAMAAGLLVVFFWALRGSLLLPVRLGKHTQLELRLRVTGPEPGLEESVCALVWLRENGTLRGSITIEDCGMDEETRQLARLLQKRWDCVCLGWDGKEWTNAANRPSSQAGS
mgnify:CR=1 FL=1